MRLFVLVVLGVVLAGCAQPQPEQSTSSAPSQPQPTQAEAPTASCSDFCNTPEPKEERWSGSIAAHTPALGVSDEPHRFTLGTNTTVTLTVTVGGPGAGSVQVSLLDGRGNVLLQGDAQPPVTVTGLVPKGTVFGHVTGGQSGVGAMRTFDAVATWSE